MAKTLRLYQPIIDQTVKQKARKKPTNFHKKEVMMTLSKNNFFGGSMIRSSEYVKYVKCSKPCGMIGVNANFVEDILHNQVLITSTAACLFAQALKPFTSALSGEGVNWKLLIKSGGMPSSHSAVVTAIATALCLQRGASDPIFGILVVYASIVMYDAQGVRRAVGKQAEVINSLVIPSIEKQAKSTVAATDFLGYSDQSAVFPPPTSIGMELATNARKAELAFVANQRTLGLGQTESRERGNSIGTELITNARNLELSFVEKRQTPSLHFALSDNSTAFAPNPLDLKEKLRRKLDGEAFKSGIVPDAVVCPPAREVTAVPMLDNSANGKSRSLPLKSTKEGWRHIPLKETVGHTKAEVAAGAVAGIAIALILQQLGFYPLL